MTPAVTIVDIHRFLTAVDSCATSERHPDLGRLAEQRGIEILYESESFIAALLDRSGLTEDCKRRTESGFDELMR